MSTQLIDDLVARVGDLPPVPQTLTRLIHIVNDPASSVAEVVQTVRYDQGLTADVLRLCNSAYFGLSRTIVSLDDAVRLLGMNKVLQLVFAVHARGTLSRPQAGYGLRAGALWTHSVSVALGAQRLARLLGLRQVGLAFTAGLLHDVGKVVLSELVARQFAEIIHRVSHEHLSFVEAEQQVLHFTHPEVGARLAETWKLPASIADCIRYHHEPDAAPPPAPLVDAVHLADVVCTALGLGGGDDGLSYRASPAVLARHDLTDVTLEAVGADVIMELKSVQVSLTGK